MSDKHETIADIIAEKRTLAAEMEKALGDQHSSVEMLKDDADRLEAAWKREKTAIEADALTVGGIVEAERKRERGNAAKLREALVSVQKKIHYLIGSLNVANSLVANRMEINGIINAALSTPPRNCDRFGGDYKKLNAAWFDWTGTPDGQNADGTVKLTFAEWLLAPATEKEGGNDGSK